VYEVLTYQVRDVMSPPVVANVRATLADVEAILEKNRFNALPIVDDESRLMGIVTTLDLLRAFAFDDDSILPPYDEIMQRPVSGILSPDALTVPPRQSLTRTLEKMVKTRNKSFPVVDEDGRLVGVVAREDVMRALRRAAAGERPTASD
jgi:CBS domain-containing protein